MYRQRLRFVQRRFHNRRGRRGPGAANEQHGEHHSRRRAETKQQRLCEDSSQWRLYVQQRRRRGHALPSLHQQDLGGEGQRQQQLPLAHHAAEPECRSTQDEAEQPRHGRGQAGRVPLHRCRLQRYPRIKRGQCVVRRGDQRGRQCRFEACGEDLQDPHAHRTLLYAPRPAPVLTLPARLRCGHGCSDISQREQHGQHQAPCRGQDLGLPEARHDGQQAALHARTEWQGWSSGPQWRAECGYLFRRDRLCPERWRPLPLSQYVDGIHHGA